MINHLSIEEVVQVHDELVDYFRQTEDPIEPSGPRDLNLLESAVARQTVGMGSAMKYSDAHSSAATLLYGLCMNHPFFNGNKRTALVAALVHLDSNGYFPSGVSHREFYDLVLALADHRLGHSRSSRHIKGADDEVKYVTQWLSSRTRKANKMERPLTFRQLRPILQRYGCDIGGAVDNFIKISRQLERVERTIFGFQKRTRYTLRTQISYAGDGSQLMVNTVHKVRKDLELDPDHGVDSSMFYDFGTQVDVTINEYRNILKRLARR